MIYVPCVASLACWRKTVSPDIFAMSMGMLRRWQAKMVFIIGMYWCARSPDTERMRMRGWRGGGAMSGYKEVSAAVVVVGFGVVVEALRVALLM